ncbi:MAG: GntR family transcriptional regulator [Deltaproteobacteria bacterium]|nr:GntR family transcriptional regulator [Deltaproteobacteria bacterium]
MRATTEISKLTRGPLPLYYQVASSMRNIILEGTWPQGSRLPTEKELSRKYGVSRPTIRNAKDILADEGLIRSIKGSGCYINNQKAPSVDNLDDIFHYGSTMSFKIHECGLIPNTDEIKAQLKTFRDRFVFQIKGVRWHQGKPISFVVYYLPFRFGSRIPLEKLDENPFIPQLEKSAGVKVVEGLQKISLDHADHDVARHLGLQKGEAVLMVRTVYFDEEHRPIEYVETKYRRELPYSIRVKRH